MNEGEDGMALEWRFEWLSQGRRALKLLGVMTVGLVW